MTPLGLAERLIALGFEPMTDFVCHDDADGNGPYIAAWLSQRKRPTPEDLANVGEVVPQSVTPSQAKIALFEAGLLDRADTLVSEHPYRPVSIWWASALAFERGHAYLNALGLELGLTDDEIDTLFIAAAKK